MIPGCSGLPPALAVATPSSMDPVIDQINRKAWKANLLGATYAEGFTDPGESAALAEATEARGQPILDIGVGGGRTIPLLRRISNDYVGIDYIPELVLACRRRFPDANVKLGDARNLSAFDSESFGLLVFSWNGIDSLGHAGRQRALREANRVLRPGGLFVFSSHNLDGPGHTEGLALGINFTRNPFELARRALRAARGVPRALWNYRRYRHLRMDARGWSMHNAAVLRHAMILHYTSFSRQLEELHEAGFTGRTRAFSNVDGRLVAPGDDTHTIWWFHYLARK